MNFESERPWLGRLRRSSLRDGIDGRQDRFERQLRDIENGALALSLTKDSVHLALEIASFESALINDHRLMLVLLIMISLAAIEEGSTRFPITGPLSLQPMRRMLNALCGDSFGHDDAERMRLGIEELLASQVARGVVGASPDDYKPLLYLPPFIYQHRSLVAEIRLAKRLAGLIRTPLEEYGEHIHEVTNDFQVPGGLVLSGEQMTSVRSAAQAPLTIISGGPGTGKTSIILAIVNLFISIGINPAEISLAAPTGKAAHRIGEMIRIKSKEGRPNIALPSEIAEPETVHRLLGYSPTLRRFRHHRNNPLTAKIVIVDEASMLDLELMSRLLEAMPPGSRLVLLGDADQLPSVSAGAVFRDLVSAPSQQSVSPVALNGVRLTHSYRLKTDGSALFSLATEINSGAFAAIAIRELEHLEFSGAEWVVAEALPSKFVDRWYAEQVRSGPEIDGLKNQVFDMTDSGFVPSACADIRRIFAATARAKILCVTRVLNSGSQRLNSLLHQCAMRDKRSSYGREEFLAGEPVMVLRNNYDRMLFNGDQGVVLRVRRPASEVAMMAVFPRGAGFVAFGVDTLRQHLELSYAMTVHKAQGSEFDTVALLMPERDIPILSREIMYTAVSRARRSITVMGSRSVVEAAVARKIERYSGVREHLERYLDETKPG